MKHITLTSLLFLFGAATYGQSEYTSTTELSRKTIPSPSVASMLKFTDIPVNMYNGTPDISIPIYTINTGKITWPIILRYNASGIRVNENSGNCGLGFSISAEGVISQGVMGIKDNGTYQSDGLAWTTESVLPTTPEKFTMLINLSLGHLDGVPDIFSFNFGKYSGRFINADQVRMLPFNDLEVSSYMEGGNVAWKIVAEDGTQYYFSAREVTANKTAVSISSAPTWYLTKVLSADATDSLVFIYEDTYLESGFGLNYEIDTWRPDDGVTTTFDIDMEPGDPPIIGAPTIYNQQTTGKQLKQILFRNGSIEYDIAWNDRQDLATTGSATFRVPRIKNIFVKNADNTIIQTVRFEHGYFSTSSGAGITGKRLKLLSLGIAPTPADIGTAAEQKYTFEYSTVSLPDKQSCAIDHWGYYNGANTNPTLIPTLKYPGMTYYGANREANPSFNQAGMLRKIIYPTGGYSLFDYDIHSFRDPHIAFKDTVISGMLVCEGAATLQTEESGWIHIPSGAIYEAATATFNTIAAYPVGSTSEFINHAASKAILYEVGTSGTVTKSTHSFSYSSSGGYTKSTVIDLTPGKDYWIKIQSQGGAGCTVNSRLTVSWPWMDSLAVRYVGGCRISKLTLFDPVTGKSTIRKYSYSDARVFRWPEYMWNIYKYVPPLDDPDPEDDPPPCMRTEILGLHLSANSLYSLGLGSHVGYDTVRETIGDLGEGGQTIGYFTNFNDITVVGEINPSWCMGQLKKKEHFSSAGTKVAEEKYQVKIKEDYGVHFAGRSASLVGNHPCATEFNVGEYPIHFNFKVYDFPVQRIYTDTVVQTDWVSGTSQVTINLYDNIWHQMPTRNILLQSDGSKIVTYNKYPSDLTLSGSSFTGAVAAIKALQDKHIHTPVIEQYVQREISPTSKLTIGATYNQFRLLDGKVVADSRHVVEQTAGLSNFAPLVISGSTLTKDSRYTEREKAEEYDPAANLLTLSTPGSRRMGYIYGYNNAMPIATTANIPTAGVTAFSSFEKQSAGNWLYDESLVTGTYFFTGLRSINLTGGGVSFAGASIATLSGAAISLPGRYIVSYWKKGGTVTVNSAAPTLTGITANGWTYCEHLLNNPSGVTVSGNTYIDELRLYPESGQMKSYTYNPLVGITSEDDAAGRILFYEYDTMGRLKTVKDVYGKILNNYTYQIQGAE